MLTLALLAAAGTLQFLEQPLPDARIGPAAPLTGLPAVNFLQADLNGDGAMDLLLPGFANIQVDGAFPERARTPLPPSGQTTEIDVFGGALFYRAPGSLLVFLLEDGAWRTDIDQPLDWPGEALPFAPAGARAGAAAFRRFAYDIDGDGAPELVALDASGVHLFRRQNGRYALAGQLHVFPAMAISRPAPQAIWPPAARRVVLPEQQMSCRVILGGGELSILTESESADKTTVYRRTRYRLEIGGGGEFSARESGAETSAPLPLHVRPCRLNGDGRLDYAGSRWTLSQATPAPVPIHENWASLDGGETFHIERAPCFPQFRPHAPFLDVDSDGDMDMLMESTTIFEGGLRETASQYLSRKSITHVVRIHAQENGSFSRTAGVKCAIEIELDSAPASPGPMLARYQAGELVNLMGDFDGDGFHDLMARTAPGNVEIRLADGWNGFGARPSIALAVPENARVTVADINGDGLADLLVNAGEGSLDGSPDATAHLSIRNPE